MGLVKFIFVGLLLLPAAEIAAFIVVAAQIGIGRALLLVLAACLAGLVILRRAGSVQIDKVRRAAAERSPIALESADLLLVLAGILLLVPGFVTDLAAVALLVPPLRRWIAASSGRALARRNARRRGAVIELEREEWRRVPEDKIEDQRRGRR
jgi:UPF0716 protein FxsA